MKNKIRIALVLKLKYHFGTWCLTPFVIMTSFMQMYPKHVDGRNNHHCIFINNSWYLALLGGLFVSFAESFLLFFSASPVDDKLYFLFLFPCIYTDLFLTFSSCFVFFFVFVRNFPVFENYLRVSFLIFFIKCDRRV